MRKPYKIPGGKRAIVKSQAVLALRALRGGVLYGRTHEISVL